jgi:hypothetical protein
LVEEPKTAEERQTVAEECTTKLELKAIPAVLDSLDDKTNTAYAAWPDRLFLIGQGGKIVYAGGPGPKGFDPKELEKAIEDYMKPKSK